MGIINILDTQTANMIAAGEVVDRPASALKELIENALDAGATAISAEVRGGGSELLRVTDNGGGFHRDDIPKALLRHATSKIKTGADLDGVLSLGFRGEALAAIGSVSRMEILSRRPEDELGTRLTADEDGIVMEDAGCPAGTSVTVKNLFYNTPARRKFMKKDSAESAAASSAVERAALSRPDISFSFTSESGVKFRTPGDGKLLSAIYSVLGRDFAAGLKEVNYTLDGVTVSGFVTSPDSARGSRALQIFFVNGRSIRSKTISAALEEAFRSYLPHGRFPAGVINITLDAKNTDVNVHPAKLEIKFSDERKIFSAVYYAVKNMLSVPENISAPMEQAPTEQTARPEHSAPAGAGYSGASSGYSPPRPQPVGDVLGYEVFKPNIGEDDLPPLTLSGDGIMTLKSPEDYTAPPAREVCLPEEAPAELFTPEKSYKIIGEAWNAFILVEIPGELLIIDKHAAHERILYNALADKKQAVSQRLIEGIVLNLPRDQAQIIAENAEYLEEYGFSAEPFGDGAVILRAVPASIADISGLGGLIEDFAASLSEGNALPFAERCDRALFTVACKAAMKAGQNNHPVHNEWLVERMFEGGDIRFCPHGRPVTKRFSKNEVEKFFRRT